MNIASVLRDLAERHPGQLAIVERDRAISFADLNRAVAAAASRLADLGVSKGTRVLVLSPMSIDLYIVLIAVFRRGATAVIADPSAGLRNFEACLARVHADAFVGVARAHLLRLVSPALRAIPVKLTVRSLVEQGRAPGDRSSEVVPCDSETPAIITFTSGSTGIPKAAVLTHGFLLAQHRALARTLTHEVGDMDLTTLPVVLLANLASGVTSIIPDADLRKPGAVRPRPIFEQIRTWSARRIVATPALLEQLVRSVEEVEGTLDGVEQIFTGGAPVFPPLLDRVARIAPRARVAAIYGSTEAEPIASLDWRDIGAEDRCAMRNGRGLLAGSPEAGVDVRIVPDQWGTPISVGRRRELPTSMDVNEPGEIVVAGEHVLRGYLDGVGDEETKIRVGDRVWHRTGDAGYFDARGRLWLLGRCAAKVSDDDGVLYPFAVECAASEVAGVRRSAFVSHRGRRVLVVETTTDALRVRESLGQRLAWAKLADVRVVRRVPVDRRHNAKVNYPALRRLLAGAGTLKRDCHS